MRNGPRGGFGNMATLTVFTVIVTFTGEPLGVGAAWENPQVAPGGKFSVKVVGLRPRP